MLGHRHRPGRPRGSTSGRVPPNGYPSVSDDLAAFLAGFIEGEGSFNIRRQSRGQYACEMQIKVRLDELALLRQLHESTRIGTLQPRAARGPSCPQVEWAVHAKSDCVRLSELLINFPLRGRKSRDFAIWCAALQWWTAGDPTKTIPNRDWAPMAYLKERLQEGRVYEVQPTRIDEAHGGLIRDWPDYLVGFFTAEGYLGIVQTAPGVLRPQAAIRVRRDDHRLLAELCRRTDAGRIYDGEQRAGSPVTQWIVCSRDDLMKLVDTFDRHPLRGRKLREYGIWREAVALYANSRRRVREHHGRLNSLRMSLQQARVYRRPSAVASLTLERSKP